MFEYYTEKMLNKMKKYALKKFIKSDYLKETTSIIPLTFLTIITRGIFNFLITSRIQTNVYIIDNIIALIVTIGFTLGSPFIYNIFNTILENETKIFSTHVINSFWKDGWIFFEYWKIRIMGTLGISLIFILFFVEINSLMIQEFIFHTLISSIIIELITMKINEDTTTKLLDKNIVIIESYSPIENYKQE